ncbi:ferrous iron transporter B [Candidatus Woesearchaeota archaeon]|nr:ferrous iron transporter B [Candidatus Woesearchaeota archaeon]
MSCHDDHPKAISGKLLVLVGNPNAGKSVIFHHLTGKYVTVSNYPGTTIQLEQGKFQTYTVIDTPGVYGVSSFTHEEQITHDIIFQATKIVNVVHALHLERDLFLTLQLLETGLPLVVVLNFMDEARKQGQVINVDLLAKRLGVDVIPTTAPTGEGIPLLLGKLQQKKQQENSRAVQRTKLREHEQEIIYRERRKKVNELVAEVVKVKQTKKTIKQRLAEMMIHPFGGILVLIVVLFLAYELIGVFVAQTVVGITEGTIMNGYYVPFITRVVSFFSLPEWLRTLLVGEFGVLTMTITYVLGLLLPLVAGFYLFLSFIEDSGYLPRLAFLIDKWLTRVGLNGKAVVPLILGFGCVTMATITTRMLDTKREKTIASTLLNFAIPCSAQLAVITALIVVAGWKVALLYVFIIFMLFTLLGTFLHAMLPGESSSLLLSLPALQLPRAKNILIKTAYRTLHFLSEAGIWFFIGALLISILQLTNVLVLIEHALRPLVVSWMGLPPEAAIGYIMGIVRRDFGAAGFYHLELNALQLLVALVSITIFVPCIAAILILYKERGTKTATLLWTGTIVVAFFIGGLIFQIGRLFYG